MFTFLTQEVHSVDHDRESADVDRSDARRRHARGRFHARQDLRVRPTQDRRASAQHHCSQELHPVTAFPVRQKQTGQSPAVTHPDRVLLSMLMCKPLAVVVLSIFRLQISPLQQQQRGRCAETSLEQTQRQSRCCVDVDSDATVPFRFQDSFRFVPLYRILRILRNASCFQ